MRLTTPHGPRGSALSFEEQGGSASRISCRAGRRPAPVWRGPLLALLVAASVSAACGRKGPPLTPFLLVPAAPTIDAPRRLGDEVVLRVTVPGANLDGSKPAAVTRVDVYGATALTPPPRTRFLEIAELVATIPVSPAGEPGDAVLPAPDPAKGVVQGTVAMVRDTLGAETFVPRELAPTPAEQRAAASAPATAAAVPPPTQLRRFYMAVAFRDRGRSGPPSAVVELPLTVLPPPPETLVAGQTELGISLEWTPSGGLLGWLLDRGLPLEADPVLLAPRPATLKPPPAPVDWLPGPTLYNVYRELAPDPLALPAAASAAAWNVAVPSPVNPAPLAVLRFDDPAPADDRERCYYVRAIRSGVEGPPSPRRCVRALDVFPPATPTNLSAISTPGAINLIWDPNVDQDLAGYLVLRSEDAGATLLPLTTAPVAQNRFTDATVKAGVQYTYEVRAVDSRVPVPNVSEPVRVTETAR